MHNLVNDPRYANVSRELKYLLKEQMTNADEENPIILHALKVRKK